MNLHDFTGEDLQREGYKR